MAGKSLKEDVVLRQVVRINHGSVAGGMKWMPLLTRKQDVIYPQSIKFCLGNKELGGSLIIHLNLLDADEISDLGEEVCGCTIYRQYMIRNSPEPRIHVLLHEDATRKFSRYVLNKIFM